MGTDIEDFVENHFLELGSDIGFFEKILKDLFRDAFGEVWNKSIEKDIPVENIIGIY